MLGFCGTFTGVIDGKGRLSIPSKIRPGNLESSKKKGIPSGERMILAEGLDGCLSLYPEAEWALVEKRFETLSFTQKKYRYFNRRMHQNTIPVDIDKSGRILIPENLRNLAGIKKDVLLVGVNQTIEIWDPIRYQEYLDNYGQTFEEVAERLFRDDPGE